MRISITPDAAPGTKGEFEVSDFIATSYRLRFRFEDEAAPSRLHDMLGGAGYSSRAFALTTGDGATFYGCRISTETGREIGVDFRARS